MTLDAFKLHHKVLTDYSDYVQSFLNIRDPEIRAVIDRELDQGRLWPKPLLQLNPAYESAGTVADLVREGVLHPDCGRILLDKSGNSFRLHWHQQEAIKLAAHREPYVVTTGTGSGKSMTYLIPIIDHILRNDPARHTVRAVIVYPMNALINSQLEAIRVLSKNMTPFPIRFDRYTGQESDAEKQRILNDPPHILLTNYVMLELMLTRARERVMFEKTMGAPDLSFLVLDELHTYTGRQGADVDADPAVARTCQQSEPDVCRHQCNDGRRWHAAQPAPTSSCRGPEAVWRHGQARQRDRRASETDGTAC